ncbi:MAG TPA: V-type ATP synthase subunit E family protein [Candidatus Methanofastidiosa archaeon]|nr:V-type ATP synthase subunit E family protein [Candidatus Methanofastidiosa archaeon]HPR41018.1 V-type ATP synthase subunit E family protein [Candidatus Methanofastidiosa archaeon]
MSLEKVLGQITVMTEKEVEEILDEGRREADQILEKAKNDIEDLRLKKENELHGTLQELKEIKLSKIRMEYKRKKLDMEKEVIHRLWNRVREKVSDLEPGVNEKLLKRLLHIARATPVYAICSIAYKGGDVCEVPTKRPFYISSNKRDEEFIRGYSDLEYENNIECIGGVVAESENRNWKINLTYDSILEEVFDNSLKKVYKSLLGE